MKKANGIRSLVQWNTQFCPRKTKVNAYQSLVIPVVEYASTVWCPHTKKNIMKVESVQRQIRSLGYVGLAPYKQCHSDVGISCLAKPGNTPKSCSNYYASQGHLQSGRHRCLSVSRTSCHERQRCYSIHNTLCKNHSIQVQLLSIASQTGTTFRLRWHTFHSIVFVIVLSLIHIWRCRRIERCRSRWSPYH